MKKKLKNRFEKKLDAQLKKSKRKYVYEKVKIPYTISGLYYPDWIVYHNSGDGFFLIEAKGHFRPEAKRKMVAVKQQHPELDIRIVFYSANKKYIKWAEKYGFPYAIGDIPEEWLNGK